MMPVVTGRRVVLYFSSTLHERISITRNLPGTNDMVLGLSSDADIGATGDLVTNKERGTRNGNAQDSNDGIGGRVFEPSLGERRLGLTGHTGTRTAHHAALNNSGPEEQIQRGRIIRR